MKVIVIKKVMVKGKSTKVGTVLEVDGKELFDLKSVDAVKPYVEPTVEPTVEDSAKVKKGKK